MRKKPQEKNPEESDIELETIDVEIELGSFEFEPPEKEICWNCEGVGCEECDYEGYKIQDELGQEN